MIVCKNCGHHNADGESFCSSCGTYLEWTGEAIPSSQLAARGRLPDREPAEAEVLESSGQGVGLREGAGSEVSPPSGGGRMPETVPSLEAPASAAAPSHDDTNTQPVIGRSTSEPPTSRQPQAVRPGAERPRVAPRTVGVPDRPQIHLGDLICGECGTGNDPVRKFCRRCGASLSSATVAAIPWYRRLFPSRKVLLAGERPHRQALSQAAPRVLGNMARLAVAGAILLAIVAYGLVPAVRSNVNETIANLITAVRHQLIPRYDRVYAHDARASGAVAGHSPLMTIDGFSNTYWAADVSRGQKPSLTIAFDHPVDLAKILITSGASADFQAEPRPHDIQLVFSDQSTKTITLRDDQKPQEYAVDAKQVKSIEIRILSVYAALQGQGTAVALTEVEFFTAD